MVARQPMMFEEKIMKIADWFVETGSIVVAGRSLVQISEEFVVGTNEERVDAAREGVGNSVVGVAG